MNSPEPDSRRLAENAEEPAVGKNAEPAAEESSAAPAKKNKWKKTLLIIALLLLLIVSGGIALINHYLNKIDHIDNATLSMLSPEELARIMATEETDEYREGYIILTPTAVGSRPASAGETSGSSSAVSSTAGSSAAPFIPQKVKDLFRETLDGEDVSGKENESGDPEGEYYYIGEGEYYYVSNGDVRYVSGDPSGDGYVSTPDWDIADSLNDEGLINIMLIGQDSRSGGSRDRSDTMLLLSVNPSTHKMALISFLRDLYLPISDAYGRNRLNTAYMIGGFPFMYEVFNRNFGLHIDGGAAVNFGQFRNIVDLIGGVDLELSSAEADALIRTIYDSYWDTQYWDGPLSDDPLPPAVPTSASQMAEASAAESTEEARETGKAAESEAGTVNETPEETGESTEVSTEESTEEKTAESTETAAESPETAAESTETAAESPETAAVSTETEESTEAAGKETDPSDSLESLVDPGNDPAGGEEPGESESSGAEETPEDAEAGTSEEETESREEEVSSAEIPEDTGREETAGQTAEETQPEQSGDRSETSSEENMPDVSNIHAGWCHLDGNQALAYCRMRHLDGDVERTERQRRVVTLLFNKVRNMDLGSLNSLLNTVLPMISTDLSNGEIMSYAAQILPYLGSAELYTDRIPADDRFYFAYVNGMAVELSNQTVCMAKLRQFLPF